MNSLILHQLFRSDLGEDEDPDSNDERFFGNDYPEEEECDDYSSEEDSYADYKKTYRQHFQERNSGNQNDGEWEDISNSDDSDGHQASMNAWGDEEFDFELDGNPTDYDLAEADKDFDHVMGLQQDNAYPEKGSRKSQGTDIKRSKVQKQAQKLAQVQNGGKTGDSKSNRSVGRVLHPFTREDPFVPLPKKSGALKQLWDGAASEAEFGLVSGAEEEIAMLRMGAGSNVPNEKAERLKQMDERLGLVAYESNANEFDPSGLPKYGQELSDDERDITLLREAYSGDIAWMGDGTVHVPGTNGNCSKSTDYSMIQLAKQTHNMIAYDSDLDCSSDGNNAMSDGDIEN